MSSLKFFTTKLFQKLSNSLSQMEVPLKNRARQLAKYIFAKTRFTSHVSFLSNCLRLQVVPKGYQTNFYPRFPTINTSLNSIIDAYPNAHVLSCAEPFWTWTLVSNLSLKNWFVISVRFVPPALLKWPTLWSIVFVQIIQNSMTFLWTIRNLSLITSDPTSAPLILTSPVRRPRLLPLLKTWNCPMILYPSSVKDLLLNFKGVVLKSIRMLKPFLDIWGWRLSFTIASSQTSSRSFWKASTLYLKVDPLFWPITILFNIIYYSKI